MTEELRSAHMCSFHGVPVANGMLQSVCIRIWTGLAKLAIRKANKHFCHFSGRARRTRIT